MVSFTVCLAHTRRIMSIISDKPYPRLPQLLPQLSVCVSLPLSLPFSSAACWLAHVLPPFFNMLMVIHANEKNKSQDCKNNKG